MGEDLRFHMHEVRKNILVPALKKAQKTDGVKASIVADKLVVNRHRYTFNKILSRWRPDQPQPQQNDIYVQNALVLDLPSMHETVKKHQTTPKKVLPLRHLYFKQVSCLPFHYMTLTG